MSFRYGESAEFRRDLDRWIEREDPRITEWERTRCPVCEGERPEDDDVPCTACNGTGKRPDFNEDAWFDDGDYWYPDPDLERDLRIEREMDGTL